MAYLREGKPEGIVGTPEFVATWSQVHVALEPQSCLLVSEARETCGVLCSQL